MKYSLLAQTYCGCTTNLRRAHALLLVGLACVLCGAAPAVEDAPLPLLHETFAGHFLVGVSVERAELPDVAGDAPHAGLLAHFNVVTPENAMKWDKLQPVEGAFDFSEADAIVEYASEQEKHITGHALVWHRQTPGWIFKAADGSPAPREQVIARLRTHIHTAMQRYRGKVTGWDVVNEALSETPSEYLRDTPWLRALGEEYIALAFKFAREADPGAKLYYNDFGLELPHKREKMVRLVAGLRAAGATPDAVNVQGHFSLGFPHVSEIELTLKAIAALGLRANISELDVSVFDFFQRGDPYLEGLPAEVLQRQAERYGELFALFLRYRSGIDRVTFWNLHDGCSWLNDEPVPGRKDYPLLFDRRGSPKPAFFSVTKSVRGIDSSPQGL